MERQELRGRLVDEMIRAQRAIREAQALVDLAARVVARSARNRPERPGQVSGSSPHAPPRLRFMVVAAFAAVAGLESPQGRPGAGPWCDHGTVPIAAVGDHSASINVVSSTAEPPW
jgi:hypothetical protein